MANKRTSSRLQRIEDRKNRQQGILFIFLSIGFVLMLVFIGFPLFVKAAVFLGDMKSSGNQVEKPDITPLLPPSLQSDYEATNSATINISGNAKPGSTVVLIVNNSKKGEDIADKEGAFTFSNIPLTVGSNLLSAYTTDSTGNKSLKSELTIIYDNKAPDLEITNPSDGAKFYDNDEEIVIAGKTEPEVNVNVNGYVVVVDNEGNFVKRYKLLTGDNTIEVVARDIAGNETKKSITVFYSR